MPGAFTEFAPAKVNLALHVLGRRSDGFHEIDSLVAFADLGDELQFEPAAEFAMTVSGPFARSLPHFEDNIISKTLQAVEAIAFARGRSLPPVSLHLVKNLPVAAGMGGGSADAAAAMRGLLHMAGIDSADAHIEGAALSLGADVPACLLSRACRMQGIGERITALANFKPLAAVLINPLIAVDTAAVFAKLGLGRGEKHGEPPTDSFGIESWRNDLTPAALALVPEIAQVLAALQTQDGLHLAQMSGSGATCYGLFDSPEAAGRTTGALSTAFPQWWVRQVTLS